MWYDIIFHTLNEIMWIGGIIAGLLQAQLVDGRTLAGPTSGWWIRNAWKVMSHGYVSLAPNLNYPRRYVARTSYVRTKLQIMWHDHIPQYVTPNCISRQDERMTSHIPAHRLGPAALLRVQRPGVVHPRPCSLSAALHLAPAGCSFNWAGHIVTWPM